MLMLALLLVISPFLAQDQTTDPTAIPTATLDTAFVEECRSKLELVLHHQAEVDAGNERPDDHLDDAKYNYENFGCTWDMFNPTPTPVTTEAPVATTVAGQVTPVPTATVDTAFVDECRSKLELVLHHQAEVNAGNENPDDHLDDAIYNYENFGCTWDMFNPTPTPTEVATTPAVAAVATATPVATTRSLA